MSVKLKATRFVAKQIWLVKKESPTLLFISGVACVGTSTVLACKATMKVPGLLDIAEKNLYAIDRLSEDENYAKNHRRAELAKHKAALAKEFVKLYGIPSVLMVVGIASLSGSHYLLNKRNAALTAAYAGLETTYREYRRRVAAEVGDERERELHYEAQNAALHERNKDGSVSTSRRITPNGTSVYGRFFDRTNGNWSPVPEYNRIFLWGQQKYANDRLNSRGYLFLNELLHDLGFEKTVAGQCVGWVLSEDSDDFVDFGIFVPGEQMVYREFVNAGDGDILLDFNVAGNILDRVPLRAK